MESMGQARTSEVLRDARIGNFHIYNEKKLKSVLHQ